MSNRRIPLLLLVLVLASAIAWMARLSSTAAGTDPALSRAEVVNREQAHSEELPVTARNEPEPPVGAPGTQRQPVGDPAAPLQDSEHEPVIDLDEPIDPPLDPVELGDCRLQLELYNAATGEAVGGMVNLWRIGAPQNEHWTVGDQLQQPLQVPRDGLTVENLPRGVYRAYLPGARRGASASAEFEVRGEWTTQRVPVDLPGQHEVFLQLYDESGRQLDHVRMREGSRSARLVEAQMPWQKKRVLRSGQAFLDVRGYGGGFSGSSRSGFRPAVLAEEGFRLGMFGGDTRTARYSQDIRLMQPETFETGVSFAIGEHEGAPLIFAAPFVSASRLLAGVNYPDGRPVQVDDGKVHIFVDAVPVTSGSGPDAWRNAQIRLWVAVPGYERGVFEATLEEYLAGDRRLVAETDKAE